MIKDEILKKMDDLFQINTEIRGKSQEKIELSRQLVLISNELRTSNGNTSFPAPNS